MFSHSPQDTRRAPHASGLRRRSPPRWSGVVAIAATLALTACAEAPTKSTAPAPTVVSLQDYMQQASKAVSEGAPDKARDAYRSAAKAYPASKEPWSKLSEDYLASGDHGNAILAAQEVLLRDTNDAVATNVLAVSGLRVSTSALQALRVQNRVAGETRSEAETMTRTLRTVLGEDAPGTRTASMNPPPKPRPRPHPVLNGKPAGPAASAASAVAAATPPAPPPGNPFDKLK